MGSVPFTVVKLPAWSDRKDLGCHTGTISDAFLELWKAGKLTNARKEVERIGRMSNVISIGGGVELDLMGQENAESAGTRRLSGIGGQMDFLEGACRSRGGKGFICLNAVHRYKDGTLKSNIVPYFFSGSAVSVPRTMVQYVATEYRIARISGQTLRERAEAMIAIAHPDFRDSWAQYAQEHFQ